MNVAMQRDIGAFLKSIRAYGPTRLTTGTTTYVGTIIDRRPGSTANASVLHDLMLSAKVGLSLKGSTALTAGTIALRLQDCATTVSSDFADYADKDGTTVLSQALTSAARTAHATADFDLSGADRYIRVELTETAISTGDVIDVCGQLTFAGSDTVPPA